MHVSTQPSEMEPIAFSKAIIKTRGIFCSSIDCFQYVRLGQPFRQHFGLYIAKLESAVMQLTRWGESMCFLDAMFDRQKLYDKAKWEEADIERAGKWLTMIQTAFLNAKTISDQFKELHEDVDAASESLQIPDQDAEMDKEDQIVKRLVTNLRKITHPRRKNFPPHDQQEVGALNQAPWVIYRKSEFEGLVNSVCTIADNLVRLFPALHSEQTALCLIEAEVVGPDCYEKLANVLHRNDRFLFDTMSQ
ncbi:small s protein [Colletotrichum limetticola]|uniref:Small s protein n=1 Tax=Colletotrichum limetticola TaxID=1209924 RepID=A0ABQ9QC89_9PEZI|nr:small s protein [Colletotrichum limetticola]